jgi:hypothetical protein
MRTASVQLGECERRPALTGRPTARRRQLIHRRGLDRFQASLGIAEKASDLVMAYLKEQTTASRL